MKHSTKDSKEGYAMLVKSLIKNPGVVQPIGKKGFGSSGLYIRNKLFAFLSYKNQLILKLPKGRVDELVSHGDGMYWYPYRNGRARKEWVVLKPSSSPKWKALTKEAMRFVNLSETLRMGYDKSCYEDYTQA